MGKRKIEIKKIDDRQKKSVTFTKRRDGLFKKAETACQKFGLQIGIIAFSPAGKPFTFINSSSSSVSVSLDEIIDTYLSSSSSNSSSSSMVMGKRNRSDGNGDDVQVTETDKKKKKQKLVMNDADISPPPPPPCITVQDEEEEEEEEEEKSDEGFQWDQIYEQEFTNELMGDGGNSVVIVTGEMTIQSSQFLVEEDESHNCCWAPPDIELQEIINLDDDFEYDDHHHHHPHHDDTTMGLLPPPHTTTSTTSTSFCDLMTASDMNEEEEVGGANENEDYGYTLEEWEHILSTSSPTSVVDNSMLSSSSYMNQEVAQAQWPTQEFLHLLCS